MARLLAIAVSVAFTGLAHAGFQWTAANWTATPSIVIQGNQPNTGSGIVSVGALSDNGVTAHMVAYAGTSSGGFSANSAVASLTLTRTFRILEEEPGQLQTVVFSRFALGSVDNNPIPGNHFGSYSYTGSVFNDSYNPLFGGSSLDLLNQGTLMLAPGDYTFSGTFAVGSFRTSGPPVTATFDVGVSYLAIVPEPQIGLVLGMAVAALSVQSRLRSSRRLRKTRGLPTESN